MKNRSMDGWARLSDTDLVRLAKAKDRLAFSELWARHHQASLNLAVLILRRPQDAQEIVQDSWLAAWVNLEFFEERASFQSWLFKIVRNRSLMRLRTAWHRSAVPLETSAGTLPAVPHDFASEGPSPEEQAATAECVETLRTKVARLPRRHRDPLMAIYLEEEALDAAAVRLGLTPAALKSRLHRGRSSLKDALSGEAPYLLAVG